MISNVNANLYNIQKEISRSSKTFECLYDADFNV